MPAERFTKKANTKKKKRQWDHVYKSAKRRGASPGSAIRQANSVVKRGKKLTEKQKAERRAAGRTKRATTHWYDYEHPNPLNMPKRGRAKRGQITEITPIDDRTGKPLKRK